MDYVTEAQIVKKRKKSEGNFVRVWKQFRKNKVAMVAGAFLLLLVILSCTVQFFIPYEKAINQDYDLRLPLSAEHPFGTDGFGRDVFARILYGTRITLIIGFSASIISSIIGTFLGAYSGYFGGVFDMILMRFLEIISSVPGLLITLTLAAGFGTGIWQMLVAIVVGQIAGFTRLIRSAVLSVAGLEYVEAARAMGARSLHIIVKHIIPNVTGTIIVQGTLAISANILLGASLGFLGLGVPEPNPEWGRMLYDSLSSMQYNPHLVLIPAACIVITATAANLVGDGLRDALDPRLKGL